MRSSHSQPLTSLQAPRTQIQPLFLEAFFLVPGRAWYRWGHPAPHPPPFIGASHPGAVPRAGGLNALRSPSLRTSLNAPHYHFHGALLQGPMEITRLSEESGSLQKRPRAPCPPRAPGRSNPARSQHRDRAPSLLGGRPAAPSPTEPAFLCGPAGCSFQE